MLDAVMTLTYFVNFMLGLGLETVETGFQKVTKFWDLEKPHTVISRSGTSILLAGITVSIGL